MSTAAERSTGFYTTFISRIDSLQASITSAATQTDLDAVVQGIIDSREILQSKDLEGHLPNRDKELYERRLKDVQQSLSAKRASLQSSQPTQSSSRTGAFSFKRSKPPSSAMNPSASVTPADTASTIPSSGIPSSAPSAEPVPSGQAAQKDTFLEQATSSGVQVTLQSRRFLTFDDLSNASNGHDGLSLSLSHLTECVLDFRHPPKPILAIHATNLTRCALLLPSIEGSALMSGVKESYIAIPGCRQFRVHSSSQTWIFLQSSSPATLEACDSLTITSLAEGELQGEDHADTNDQLVASGVYLPTQLRPEVQVQDFEAPEGGVGSTGTKSWSAPQDAQRAAVISNVLSLAVRARQSQSTGETSWLQDLATIQSPYRSSDSGLLLVFSEPGPEATLEEFHDWYDNEHVPLRTLRFPEFRTAARYEVYDSPRTPSTSASFKAGWAAAYTISSNQIYNEERYSGLRKNRSKREGELLSRVATLDRRIYTTLVGANDPTKPQGNDLRPRTADEITSEARSVYFAGFQSNKDAAAVKSWFTTKLQPLLQSQKCRPRLLRLVDALVNGKQASPANGDAKDVGRYAVYLEFEQGQVPVDEAVLPALQQSQWEEALSVQNVEVRLMKIYRGWDATKALEEVQS